MEDRHVLIPKVQVFVNDQNVGYFAVYDGHGGPRCAEYLIQNLHSNIFNSHAFSKGKYEEAMRDGFVQSDKEWLDIARREHSNDGLGIPAPFSVAMGSQSN